MKDMQPMSEREILRRLDIMSESGGMLTKDRIRAIREAAAKIREQSDAIRILQSQTVYDNDVSMSAPSDMREGGW